MAGSSEGKVSSKEKDDEGSDMDDEEEDDDEDDDKVRDGSDIGQNCQWDETESCSGHSYPKNWIHVALFFL